MNAILEDHYYLKQYLGSNYDKINRYLRDPQREEEPSLITFGNGVMDSLKKGESFNNGFVFRIDNPENYSELPFCIFSRFFLKRIGSVIEFPSFLSTTLDIGEQFKGQNVLFQIQTSVKSRGVITNSIYPRKIEAEVLFMAGSKFQILSINNEEEIINLKEVDCNHKTDFLMVQDFYFKDEELMHWVEKKNKAKGNNYIIDEF